MCISYQFNFNCSILRCNWSQWLTNKMFLNPIKYKITNNFLVYSSSAVKWLSINCSFFLTLQYSFFLSIISTKARHNTMQRQKVSIFFITLRSAYLLNKHCSIYNRQTSTNKQVWVQRLRHYHLYHLKKGTCTGLKRGRFFSLLLLFWCRRIRVKAFLFDID